MNVVNLSQEQMRREAEAIQSLQKKGRIGGPSLSPGSLGLSGAPLAMPSQRGRNLATPQPQSIPGLTQQHSQPSHHNPHHRPRNGQNKYVLNSSSL